MINTVSARAPQPSFTPAKPAISAAAAPTGLKVIPAFLANIIDTIARSNKLTFTEKKNFADAIVEAYKSGDYALITKILKLIALIEASRPKATESSSTLAELGYKRPDIAGTQTPDLAIESSPVTRLQQLLAT